MLIENLRPMARRLGVDEKGQISIIFALSLVPVLTLIGGSLDYGRALAVRTHLQSAADAAATNGMALGSNSTDAERIEVAAATLSAAADQISAEHIVPTVRMSNGELSVSMKASVPTTFLSIMHLFEIDIETTSKAASETMSEASDGTGAHACWRSIRRTRTAFISRAPTRSP